MQVSFGLNRERPERAKDAIWLEKRARFGNALAA
jgi:hypothetical protein